MPKYRISECLNILDRNVVPPMDEGSGLRAKDEELRCAQACAVVHILLHEVRRIHAARAADARELHGIPHDFFGDRHLADKALELHNLGTADRLLELNRTQRCRLADHLDFVVFREISDNDVEHEAVELGLRQRIRTFELDRVLRRENVKWLFEDVSFAFDRDRSFLHGFEQRGLRLWRRSVDFVGENDVREDWSLHKHARPFPCCPIFLDHLRAGDVGRHQVGRELDALEVEMQNLRHR